MASPASKAAATENLLALFDFNDVAVVGDFGFGEAAGDLGLEGTAGPDAAFGLRLRVAAEPGVDRVEQGVPAGANGARSA